ncbi:type II CRISPR RNA-guided endonuclease Cas9 [Actinobacillus porcinus]|uniref:type II CRISPR RNA-guided endonuclease Cas9 n=1 Tax=Actinobacillus porcinus TaxID=51048 RepID=UPI0023577812|nr:type II CRISPR RNA-guided endonuclease Cas9 [Actinobacillus porcinus]MCI5764354.1 type II CRISPR RNA-guided endonuclease Cas9 [Actinobacillus porcinus]MDY5420507.1 type II CRISPR RNA-guided endonuclease Cas9 [Actinobacillus porcinus]
MKTSSLNYILGLDLGIASVGWAVVEIDEIGNVIRLIDLGVRTFDAAETGKGEGLNLVRKSARATRRLIYRKAQRVRELRYLFKNEGLIDDVKANHKLPNNVWELRVKGLDQKLNNEEWAAILLHFVKHRGFKSSRKHQPKNDEKQGQLIKGINDNKTFLASELYRSPAELAIKKFYAEDGYIRNQRQYQHTFGRDELAAECALLFETQRKLGNPFSSKEFESKWGSIFNKQKKALSKDDMLKMVGICTFENPKYGLTEQKRAAKNTYSTERFVAIQRLQNLRIIENGEEKGLTDNEFQKILSLGYELKSGISYAQIRKELNLSENAFFKGLQYSKDTQKTENSLFLNFKFYHTLRSTLLSNNLELEWSEISKNNKLMDKIGTELSLCKNQDEFLGSLKKELSENVLNILYENITFDKFIHISLVALYKLLPLMEKGYSYVQAYTEIYGKPQIDDKKILPAIPVDDIHNPVVLRSLTQARKVINGIIRLYGSPNRIHIELSRELGKSKQDRDIIKRQNDKNRDNNDRYIKEIREHFGFEPKPKDVLKYRLFMQQNSNCIYSGKGIRYERLFEDNYVEIDHVLPLSRSWDDSFNNKVLVLKAENQNKGNLIPYEWLDGKNNSLQWREFIARVNGFENLSYSKKQNLIAHKINEDEFKLRNLNDTRYIAKYLKKHIEDNLIVLGKGRNVLTTSGRITDLLRKVWGLNKNRNLNDRHHALDAVVIACTNSKYIQQITEDIQYNRICRFTGKPKRTIFMPWEHFTENVNIRVFSESPKLELENRLPDYPQYNHEFVQPLFVSRMPIRKMTGQGHEAKLRSARKLDTEGKSIKKEFLTDLTLKNLENMMNKEREPELYQALVEHFKKYGEKTKEKFFKKGGTEVKSIRICKTQNKFVDLGNKTIADNGDIVRTDLFLKGKKYYFVNIYAWQVAEGVLPKETTTGNLLDDSYIFQFSLFKNDLLEIPHPKDEDKSIFAYFIRPDDERRWILKFHDNAKIPNIYGKKDETSIRLSIQGQKFIRKYQVDELGKNIRPCRPTKRQHVR